MEREEMLEQTNETENTETQTVEENVEGITLTDTTETVATVEEIKEVKKTLADLLKENPELQEEFNDKVEDRLRRERRIQERDKQKELSKYKDAENILKAGLEVNSIEEANERLTNFWKEKGIDIPEPVKPELSEREQQILAQADAEEIIELGKIEAEKEANLLASRYNTLNVREKAVFNTLANYLTTENQKAELQKIGVKADILEEKDFREFKQKFSPKASITDVYNLYSKTKGEKETPKPIGSMTTTEPNKVKDYYTPDEVRKLTSKDLDDPQVMKAVENSMTKWEQDKH